MKNQYQFLEKRIELSANRTDIFLLKTDLFEEYDFLSCLPEEEQERANRLKIKEKKKQFVIARGILRKLLSNSLNVSANEILFSYGEHNKPGIEQQYNNHSIEFNISHSGDYVLIAITLDNKIGVDIEIVNTEIDYQSLSNRFFSSKEKEELTGFGKEEQLDAFYRAWVRKESFIKATGKGIAFGLDQFSVSLNENKRNKIDIITPDFIDDEWFSYDLMNIDNYKAALTSYGNKKKFIFYQ